MSSGRNAMRHTAAQLKAIVDETESRLSKLTEPEASMPSRASLWSKKEVLGHLIDSASNNQQRFVRLLLDSVLYFPRYEQDGWNRAQQYQSEPWVNFVALWTSYNRHLAHFMAAINQHVLTSDFPFTDYIENVGVRPDIAFDYMTEDNLTNRGKAFVAGFTAAMLDLLQ